MSDTFVTFHGWVGGPVIYREPMGVSVASFRVGSTPRIKRDGKWIDGETTWYTVTAWRGLAENVRDSVNKGDAVMVHGKLRTETWTRDDKSVGSRTVVDATSIGHDMTRGTSAFTRSVRPERIEATVDESLRSMYDETEEDAAPVDTWGEPVQPPGADSSAGSADASAA